jgi:ferredoxin
MKVPVDEEVCLGDETCTEICPGIFEMQVFAGKKGCRMTPKISKEVI